MDKAQASGRIITLTMLIGLMLVMIPLPQWAQPLRPDWVCLIAIYWALATPERFGVTFAWLAGLLLDVVHGSILGLHALGAALVVYCAVRLHQRIRAYPLIQQGLVVAVLLALKQSLVLWVTGLLGEAPTELLVYFVPSALALLLWPWIFVVLRDLRRRYQHSASSI